MKSLPAEVTAYRRTREFTAQTVPAGLLRDHRTKEGVWGRIVVLAGAVTYHLRGETHHLEPGVDGVVEPAVTHHVTPGPDTVFYVEFLR